MRNYMNQPSMWGLKHYNHSNPTSGGVEAV